MSAAQGKAVAERQNSAEVGNLIEQVVIQGDLSRLSAEQRSSYYAEVCKSVGLNPLTQPFAYIELNRKLVLYALRGCTDQLRGLHKVSVEELTETERDGVIVVTAKVRNGEGRCDMAKGAVTVKGLAGDALANAIMKAETKAKRRATLSLCGLGFLDESEVETIPQGVAQVQQQPQKRTREEISADANRKRQQVRDVEQDVLQIDSLAALDRYQREVLTPEFMAGLGMKQWTVEQKVGERRRELEDWQKAAEKEPSDEDDAEDDEDARADAQLRDRLIEHIQQTETEEDLLVWKMSPPFRADLASLPQEMQLAVRKAGATKMKTLQMVGQ